MPIKIQADLPAREILEKENIFVMTDQRAEHQDIRPLKIAIVNLMPTKIATETQILRLLGNSPLQVEISLVHMESHVSKNTSQEHLERFYINPQELYKKKYDGIIITGAPVEQIDFFDVDYWDELCQIMDWAKTHVFSSLFICWGAQAGLYHYYGIEKTNLEKKLFGIYPHYKTTVGEPLLRGFDDIFPAPQSRHTKVDEDAVKNHEKLVVLAEGKEAGLLLAKSLDNKHIFMTGHLEYDTETLGNEYRRDLEKGLPIEMPLNYYPDNDPWQKPRSTWRSHAHLFFSNWLNYYVYQETPYEFTRE